MADFVSGSGETGKRLYYLPSQDRLVFAYAAATTSHWDEHWLRFSEPICARADLWECRVTSRYLATGARLLEGGCGLGAKVAALHRAGFNVRGIDSAEQTVVRAKRLHPNMDIRQGDVCAIDFEDGALDGYWSLGVIEHFPEGPQKVLREAARVVRPGGFLFLTAPWFSPLRRSLVRRGRIPHWGPDRLPDNFYQFAFTEADICQEVTCCGFDVVEWVPRGGVKGLSDDSDLGRRLVGLARIAPWPANGLLQKLLQLMSTPLSGHTFLAVCRRVSA